MDPNRIAPFVEAAEAHLAYSTSWTILNWFTELWPWVIAILNISAATVATVHAVLRKRDGRAVIGWVGLVWLAPVVGSVAYACFGINRIYRKAVSLQIQEAWTHRQELQLTSEEISQRTRLVNEYPHLAGLAALGQHLSGRPVLPGNRVTPLVNGDEAYPAMLRAIEQAQVSISLVSYIFDCDRAGEQFLKRLVAAHERGVEVRVLIDHVGARYSRPTMLRRLAEHNIRVAGFLPTRTAKLFPFANLRNHRKILVVDGRIGFTGGTNIREGHWLTLKPAFPVQCVHFQIEGPAVEQLQEVFAIDWAFTTGESLHGPVWFPVIERAGSVWARGIPDGPDEDFEKIPDLLQGALAAARRRARIVTPYFLPEASLISALKVTAMRGVDVEIVLPSRNNIPVVHWASQAQFWQVLERGCRIYLTPPPFDHSKLMVVDGLWSLIGSSNWDPRSLRLNFEFNVECYNAELAGRLDGLIDARIAAAREVTLQDVNTRGFPIQLRDGLARLFAPYL